MKLTFEHFIPLLIYLALILFVNVVTTIYLSYKIKKEQDWYSLKWVALSLSLITPVMALFTYPLMLNETYKYEQILDDYEKRIANCKIEIAELINQTRKLKRASKKVEK